MDTALRAGVPKYSEATKLWVALTGATLLVGLLVFLVIIAWALTDRFRAYHRKKADDTA